MSNKMSSTARLCNENKVLDTDNGLVENTNIVSDDETDIKIDLGVDEDTYISLLSKEKEENFGD